MNKRAEKTFKTIKAYRNAKAACKRLIQTKDEDNIKIACYQSISFGFFPNFNKFAKKYIRIGVNARYLFTHDFYFNSEASRIIDIKNALLLNEVGVGVYEMLETYGTYRKNEYRKSAHLPKSREYQKYMLQKEIHQKITSIQDQGDCIDQKCPYFDDCGISDYSYKVDWDYLWKNHRSIHKALVDKIGVYKSKCIENADVPF